MEDRIIIGPAMIPNKKIYRNPNRVVNKPHYVYFDELTIKVIREKFHKKNYNNKVNINHDGVLVEEVILIDSFLIDDVNRETLQPQFQDLPNGTWMVSYRIQNDDIWEKIKDKQLNGFSVEGIFEYNDANI